MIHLLFIIWYLSGLLGGIYICKKYYYLTNGDTIIFSVAAVFIGPFIPIIGYIWYYLYKHTFNKKHNIMNWWNKKI